MNNIAFQYAKLSIIVYLLLAGISTIASAQPRPGGNPTQAEMVRVFPMEDGATFDKVSLTYNQSLLMVCNDNMDKAYNLWMTMLFEMEKYATAINYDINGIKLVMKVFWNTDGTLDYIGYYLRPESRNIPIPELEAFLKGFIKSYKLPFSSTDKFSHYGGARFPTFYTPPTTPNGASNN